MGYFPVLDPKYRVHHHAGRHWGGGRVTTGLRLSPSVEYDRREYVSNVFFYWIRLTDSHSLCSLW